MSSGGASVGGFVGGIFNFFKFLVIAAIAILVLLALTQKNEPAKVTVNVPEQKPPVINVPAQQPPVVNVPAQQPPISSSRNSARGEGEPQINVPQPNVSVQVPQQKAPVVNVAADSGLGYVNTIISLASVIIGGAMLLLVIRSKSRKSGGQTRRRSLQCGVREDRARLDCGGEAQAASRPTTAEYPDLFTRDKVRK